MRQYHSSQVLGVMQPLRQAQRPFYRKLLIYARNLTGRITLTEQWVDYAQSLLSRPVRNRWLRSMARVADAFAEIDAMAMRDEEVSDAIFKRVHARSGGLPVRRFEAMLRDVLDCIIAGIKGPEYATGVTALQRLFHLERHDIELLVAITACDQNQMLDRVINHFRGAKVTSVLSAMTGLPMTSIVDRGSAAGRLARCGLIEPVSMSETHFTPVISPEILECVVGIRRHYRLHQHCRMVKRSSYPPESFLLPDHGLDIVRSLVSKRIPCNILFYGEPGTGKTEFAKSIAAACGKAACFVQTGEDGEARHRRIALTAAVHSMAPSDAVVVVDEADSMLNTHYAVSKDNSGGTLCKAWLNEFLDTCPAIVIWITNDIECMDSSTKRRFMYAVHFKRHTARQRRSLWAVHLQRHPLRSLIPENGLDALAREYRVNAGIIGQSLAAMRQLSLDTDMRSETVMATLKELLNAHLQLSGRCIPPRLAVVDAAYDPDAVSASVEPAELIDGLRAHLARRPADKRPPANLLFWGEPGTGKTALAQYLAQTLGRELLIKRASDLLSMWVGGTEKEIRSAFEEARREDTVLLLDEADSFFIDRRSALQTWETSQTNELLTQMENHQGILICCTNLVDHLDAAAMRRFCWKVRFHPLTPDGRLRLTRKYFPSAVDTLGDINLRERLARIPGLTPGDIQTVYRRFQMRPDHPPDGAMVLDALAEETTYRRHGHPVIGFAFAGATA